MIGTTTHHYMNYGKARSPAKVFALNFKVLMSGVYFPCFKAETLVFYLWGFTKSQALSVRFLDRLIFSEDPHARSL